MTYKIKQTVIDRKTLDKLKVEKEQWKQNIDLLMKLNYKLV